MKTTPLRALLGLIAAGAATSAILSAGTAHADTNDGSCGLICNASRLGESPGQIAEQLHQGDGRISTWQAQQQVWSDLQDCP